MLCVWQIEVIIIEKALLVGVRLNSLEDDFQNSMLELSRLAKTAGARVVGEVTQAQDRPNPATLIGKGKIDQAIQASKKNKCDLIIFDNELSGSQARNLEKAFGLRVIDRAGLILDIFAKRAQTAEAKLQVELALASYLLPRLTGKGIFLSKLGGGIGTRGPGETKLEYDRRRIRKKISHLKKRIEKVALHRRQLRKRRKDLTVGAIVGYTNAGKSTLLNCLTQAEVFTTDGLFATLDPTTRRLIPLTSILSPKRTGKGERGILLTDTVGFIQNLPHNLVDAFRATLEETKEADFLLHVVDISSPYFAKQMDSVGEVLEELGVAGKPTITVLNKIDQADKPTLNHCLRRTPNSVAISALKGEGIDELLKIISGESVRIC